MKANQFQFFADVFAEGLDNSEVVMFTDVFSTKDYFGSVEDFALSGQYVALYLKKEGIYMTRFEDKYFVEAHLSIEDENHPDDYIVIFNLENL